MPIIIVSVIELQIFMFLTIYQMFKSQRPRCHLPSTEAHALLPAELVKVMISGRFMKLNIIFILMVINDVGIDFLYKITQEQLDDYFFLL